MASGASSSVSSLPHVLAYLIFGWVFPLSVAVPNILSAIIGGDTYADEKLDRVRGLAITVAPMSLLYLLGLLSGIQSLLDLTVCWRLLDMTPALCLCCFAGKMDANLACLSFSTDLGIPLLAVASEPVGFLRRAFSWGDQGRRQPCTFGRCALTAEGLLGSLGAIRAAASAYFDDAPELHGLVFHVVGLYYVILLWSAWTMAPEGETVSLCSRLALLAFVLPLLRSLGWGADPLAGFFAFTALGLWANLYTRGWRRYGQVDPRRWCSWGAGVVVGLSLAWSVVASLDGAPVVSPLAFHVHRQDIFVGVFIFSLGPRLAELQHVKPTSAKLAGWLLSFSGVWLTSSTKLLVAFDAGSPLHPSWTQRGLAPVYASLASVDVFFWLATMAMTLVSTVFTAVLLLRTLSPIGASSFAWHGIAIVFASSAWMALGSSGLPAPTRALAEWGIPPIAALAVADHVDAVRVHVVDLALGISLIAWDAIFIATPVADGSKRTASAPPTAPPRLRRWAIIGLCWLASLNGKVAAYR